MQTKIFKAFFIAGSGLLLTACGTPEHLDTTTTIDYSYQAKHPITEEILISGSMLNQQYNSSTSQIFELLSGAKKGESRMGAMTDPFHKHNPQLVQKFPIVVLNEMGIEIDTTADIFELDGKNYVLGDIISENGVDKVVLDENPIETVKQLEWTFSVDAIK